MDINVCINKQNCKRRKTEVNRTLFVDQFLFDKSQNKDQIITITMAGKTCKRWRNT